MLMPIFIIVTILIIGALGAVEWNVYRQRAGAMPGQEPQARRRLRRRGLGLFLLLIELFMFAFYEAFHVRVGLPFMSLVYLGVCVILALVLFWVVIVDVRVSLAEIISTQGEISDLHAAKLEEEIEKILKEEGLTPGQPERRDSEPS